MIKVDFTGRESFNWLAEPGRGATGGGTGSAEWDGFAGYFNYKIGDQWKTSLRGEYFDDKDGFKTGVVQKWKVRNLGQ